MNKGKKAWLISHVVLLIWVVIVLGGESLSTGGDPTSLDALVHLWLPALGMAFYARSGFSRK